MRLAPVALAAAVLFALAGCVPSDAPDRPSPSPTAAPVFASDAEALAAAEKAYAAYLRVSDEIAQDGGRGADRFDSVVTKQWMSKEKAAALQLAQSGRHQVGSTLHSPLKLQQVDADASGVNVVAYSCLDLTGTRILNASGMDVTPSTRQLQLSVQVSFRSSATAPSLLLVDSNEPWSGSSFC